MPVKSTARKKLSRATQRDLDTRIEFMEGIVRRDPNYVDALQLLGDDYTQRGRFPEGLRAGGRTPRENSNRRTRSSFTTSRAATRSPGSSTAPWRPWKRR